ncbi:MAG TPA: tetratricopeptide repeat protein [Deltaproteobacteria bacterium]|nr:tetratricopeptide repeat protein [Deltaproteobacteria bacterium]HOS26268.1 tetratricopeptide repeat protein [Deltaproteobacteria bacterium]HPL87101.1 tetratricopeptide repeat protein [Deltaproteobacteria bacterium]HQM21637.1 tetratricopeptide repeat protein [Deltaproteobacteria bacterium]
MKRFTGIFLALLIPGLLLAGGCSKSPEEKREAYLRSAQSYMEKEKYAEAAIEFQNALQIAPDDAQTLVTLGEIQLKMMKASDAYKAFSRAVGIDPRNTKAHEYLTSIQLLARKYDLAEKQASIILEYEPENRKAQEMLAQALFQSGKQKEAVAIMDGLLKDPKPLEATIINAVQMYMATGRVEDALALLSSGSSLYPESSKIRFLASDIYAFKDDIKRAREWAEDAYRVEGDNINAGIALARFYAGHRMDDLFTALISELKAKFPNDPSPYLLESGIMQQKGNLDQAIALAETARKIEDTTAAKTVIAQLLLEKGDPSGAQKILAETLEKDPNAVTSRVMLARIYLQQDNPQKALDTLDTLIKSIPQRPDVAVPTAQAYLMKGDLQKARDLVEKSLQEYKDNPALHGTMAKVHFMEGKFREALSEVTLLADSSAATPDIMYIGALSALRTGQTAQASSYVESLKKSSPDSWQALHSQSLIALSKGDKKTAYRYAEKAVDLFPEKPQALTLFTSIAPSVISNQETIQKIRGACQKHNSSYCHMIVARLMETSGDVQGALSEMKEAIRLGPDDTSLYHALAQFYARNNMIRQAIDEYEGLVHAKPDDLRAATMLALLNQSQGRVSDAKKVYSYILERDPKNALAANNLSWILVQSGKSSDLNEALRLAQIAKDQFPEDARIADTLGYVYLRKGLIENALAQFQLAVEKLPEEPSINYHMALALVELSRNPEARKYVEKALDAEAAFDERQAAQELMARIESGGSQ